MLMTGERVLLGNLEREREIDRESEKGGGGGGREREEKDEQNTGTSLPAIPPHHCLAHFSLLAP